MARDEERDLRDRVRADRPQRCMSKDDAGNPNLMDCSPRVTHHQEIPLGAGDWAMGRLTWAPRPDSPPGPLHRWDMSKPNDRDAGLGLGRLSPTSATPSSMGRPGLEPQTLAASASAAAVGASAPTADGRGPSLPVSRSRRRGPQARRGNPRRR